MGIEFHGSVVNRVKEEDAQLIFALWKRIPPYSLIGASIHSRSKIVWISPVVISAVWVVQ